MQFECQATPCLATLLRQSQTRELTQELRLAGDMPEIGRVICAWGQPILRSKQWRSGSVALSGGITVNILYAPEDGGRLRWVDCWIPFQMKWDLPPVDREGQVRIWLMPGVADARVVAAKKLMVRAVVHAAAQALCPEKAEVPIPGPMPEDVQLLIRTYPVRLLREAGEKEFSIEEDLALPPECPDSAEILSCCLTPEVSDSQVSGDRLAWRGNAQVQLVLMGEDGEVFACRIDHPFAQLAQLDRAYDEDAVGDVALAVTALEPELTQEGLLRLKCSMVAQHTVEDETLVQVVEDAYSPIRDVAPMPQVLELPAILEQRCEPIPVKQTLDQSAGKILDVRLYPQPPRVSIRDGSLELELSGRSQVLYCREDGSLRSASEPWQTGWEKPASGDVKVQASLGSPAGLTASKTEQGMKLAGECRLAVQILSDSPLPAMGGLELGEVRPRDPLRPSLILGTRGSDSLWTLAKKCGTTADAIRKANGLEADPAPDRILLIPIA